MWRPLRIGVTWALRAGLALATAALLAAAGAAVLAVAVSRGWQRERVVHVLEGGLGRALDARVRIGSLEGPLFGGLRARDVEIEADDHPPLACDELDVRFAVGPLLRAHRLEIASLELTGLRGAITRAAPGWRVSGLGAPIGGTGPSEAEAGGSWLQAVHVARLAVRDAHLAIIDAPGSEPTAAPSGAAPAGTRLALGLDAGADGIGWQAGEPLSLPERLEATLAVEPSTLDGRTLREGTLALTLAGRTLRITRGTLAGGFGSLDVTEGEVAFANATWPLALARASVEVAVHGLDLAAALDEPRLASALDGPLTLVFEPDGAGATAGRLVLDARLRSTRLGEIGVGSLTLRGWLDTGSRAFRVEAARLEGGLGTVQVEGAGSPERLDALELRADLDLGQLPSAWLGGADLAGRLHAEASAQGPWSDPRGQLSAHASDLRVGERGPGTLDLRAEAPGERRLRIPELVLALPDLAVRNDGPVRVQWLPGPPRGLAIEALALDGPGLHASARGRVSGAALRDVHIDLDVGDLAALGRALGIETPPAGKVTGRLEADGPLDRPALRGELAAAPIAWGPVSFDRVELAVVPRNGSLELTGRVVDHGEPRARLEASLPRDALLAGPDALLARSDTTLQLEADHLDLAWLAAVLGLEPGALTGRLDADLRLAGARPQPRLSGRVDLVDASVAVPGLAEPLRPIEASLRLEGQEVMVERLRIPGQTGEIRAGGRIHWSATGRALAETSLGVEIENFGLPPGGIVAGRLQGALAVNGTWPSLFLGGRVELERGHVRLPEGADPAWSEIRVHGLPGEEQTPNVRPGQLPPLLEQAGANLLFVVGPKTWFQGHGADLRVTGQVRMLKDPGEEPFYTGAIRTLEGVVVFQGRRFEIERGVATLAGTRSLDPELDVVAVQKLPDVTLRVVVSGRASAPRVTLESDPPLDATDRLSYLAFGRPASGLGTSEQAKLESAATSVVGQLLMGSGVGAGLAQHLPVENLRFETGGGANGQAVGVGAEVAPGVTLHLERDFTTGDDAVRIEWQFLPRWRVQSEINEEGQTGADVIWRYEF